MKTFNGKVLFLDRSDINTDEIIPARYLTEITKEALKPFLLEDLSMDGFDPSTDLEGIRVVITRSNFGCGSSREHAPWAFEVNDINLVIGESFARIFRQNMFNCGILAIELPKENIDEILAMQGNITIGIDLENERVAVTSDITTETKEYSFVLNGFDKDLVAAGGWLAYADKNY